MKLKLIAVIAIIIAIGTANAQTVNIGIKGGLNFYTLRGDNDASFDPRTSFHAGLLGHIHVAQHFAIQPEVLYSSQGTKYANDLKLNLDYVNVPVLFQYMFDNGFRLEAGPQVGFLVGAEANENDAGDSYKGADFGMAVGASYVHPPTGFGVDLRYNCGLTDITTDRLNSYYNRGVQLGVFYLFKHKS